jgi:hypothetical protein
MHGNFILTYLRLHILGFKLASAQSAPVAHVLERFRSLRLVCYRTEDRQLFRRPLQRAKGRDIDKLRAVLDLVPNFMRGGEKKLRQAIKRKQKERPLPELPSDEEGPEALTAEASGGIPGTALLVHTELVFVIAICADRLSVAVALLFTYITTTDCLQTQHHKYRMQG